MGETRDADPVVDADLLRLLWEAGHALQAMSRHMERNLGISGPQRLVLREVGRRPDILPGELAAILGIHPSTVTGLVDKLADRGMIDRQRSTDDRRSTRLRLTTSGERLLQVRAVTIESVVQAATEGMPAERREAAAEMLSTVAKALRAAAGETAE